MSINSQLFYDSDIEELFAKVATKIQKKIKSSTIPSIIIMDQSEKQIMDGMELKDLTSIKKNIFRIAVKRRNQMKKTVYANQGFLLIILT